MAIISDVKKRKIGANLKHFRELAGLHQDDVRRKTGMAQSTLSRYENDLTQPSWYRLQVLAKAYGLSDAGLFFRDLSRHDPAVSSPDTTTSTAGPEVSIAEPIAYPSRTFIEHVRREATAAGAEISRLEKDIRQWKSRMSTLLSRASSESVRQQTSGTRAGKSGVGRVRGDGH